MPKNTFTDHNEALASASKAAQEAEQKAASARAAVVDLEAQAHAAGTAASVATWQQWLDNYDAQADQAAVVEASATLTEALTTSTLGSALIGYLAAVKRAQAHHSTALSAVANGATGDVAEIYAVRDGDGNLLRGGQSIDSWFSTVLIDTITREVATAMQAEADALLSAVTQAYDGAGARGPEGYRVERKDGGSGRVEIGATLVDFVAGVAHVPVDHPAVRYFEGAGAGYTVTPVFELPAGTQVTYAQMRVEKAQEAISRPASSQDVYRRHW